MRLTEPVTNCSFQVHDNWQAVSVEHALQVMGQSRYIDSLEPIEFLQPSTLHQNLLHGRWAWTMNLDGSRDTSSFTTCCDRWFFTNDQAPSECRLFSPPGSYQVFQTARKPWHSVIWHLPPSHSSQLSWETAAWREQLLEHSVFPLRHYKTWFPLS